MRRRSFLAAAGTTGLAATAGCFGLLETQKASREPPLPDDRPDEPYVPTHYEGMTMAGKGANGRYRAALTYTFPHRFWLTRGTDTERVNAESAEDVHLMVSVWDAEAGVALPAASPRVELTDPDGETSTLSPWQMLSQRMGVHYGDNVELGPDGDYEATVSVAPGGTRRTDGAETPDGPIPFSFSFTFEEAALNDLEFTDVPSDREGTPGVVDPMGMGFVSMGQSPPADALPVNVRGTESGAGAELVVGTADSRGNFATGSDETYVAASLRSTRSRFPLAASTLDLTVGGGESVPLVPTLDPELGYHYAAAVSGVSEDTDLQVSVTSPTQLARHEGYETAFFGFDGATF